MFIKSAVQTNFLNNPVFCDVYMIWISNILVFSKKQAGSGFESGSEIKVSVGSGSGKKKKNSDPQDSIYAVYVLNS